MGRYTGPKHRLARREGVNILDKSSASLMRRLNTPPGVHGKKGKRRVSDFGQQLRQKQMAKTMYGLYEKQFKKMVDTASAHKGDTEEILIASLETRLDNVVYRLGLAKSRMMARQIVTHGHITVNNQKMTIPSYAVQVSDVVSLSAVMQKNPDVIKSLEEKTEVAAFLERKGPIGKLTRMPKIEDVQAPFVTRQIIEYYSR